MGRILGIDYGQKRCGLAVTDPLQIIATGLETIPTASLNKWLKEYFAKEQVVLVVVGYPLGTKGDVSHTAREFVDPFVNSFRKKFPGIPIEKIDERYTSKIAFQSMIDAGLKKKDRADKAIIDTVSATLILQSYLEKRLFLQSKSKE